MGVGGDLTSKLLSIVKLICQYGVYSYLCERAHEVREQLIHFPIPAHDDGPDAPAGVIALLLKG